MDVGRCRIGVVAVSRLQPGVQAVLVGAVSRALPVFMRVSEASATQHASARQRLPATLLRILGKPHP